MLKDETWDTVYKSTCINETYCKFQGILLRNYEASFPVYYTNYKSNHNSWVTKGIKVSCIKKKELYSLYRNNKNNVQLRNYYKKILQCTKKSNK